MDMLVNRSLGCLMGQGASMVRVLEDGQITQAASLPAQSKAVGSPDI